MIKVSIIIPAYNVGEYIQRAIISIYNNNELNDIEVIVVNDGSSDNTRNKIEELMTKYKTLKLINVSNGGVSRARNIALEQANGQYIMFLDSDDWIDGRCIEKLYNSSVDNNFDIVIFNYFEVRDNKISKCFINKENSIISGDEALKEILTNDISASVWNKFIKKELFTEKIKFEDDVLVGEDLLIITKLISRAKKVCKVEECYYYYMIREDSATNRVTERTLTVKMAIQRIEEFLKDNDLMAKYREEYEFCKYLHLYFYRIIVGPIEDYIHRKFFVEYKDNDIIKNNLYYKVFIKRCKKTELLRIYLYKINYTLAKFIHKTIIKLIK